MNETLLASSDWTEVYSELIRLENNSAQLNKLCKHLDLQPSGRIYIAPMATIRNWFYRELIAYYLLYLRDSFLPTVLSVKKIPVQASELSELLTDTIRLEIDDCRNQASFSWISSLPNLEVLRLKNNKTVTSITDLSLDNLEQLELSGFTKLEKIE